MYKHVIFNMRKHISVKKKKKKIIDEIYIKILKQMILSHIKL